MIPPWHALDLCLQVRAPFVLREFASGVKVVQAASHSDDAVCARLAALVQPQPAAAAAAAAMAAATASSVDSTEGDAAAAAGVAAAGGMEARLLCTLGPGITRTDVALALEVPVAVAAEHLRMAEAQGVLCRDEGPEGLRFFRNFFADPDVTAAVAAGSAAA